MSLDALILLSACLFDCTMGIEDAAALVCDDKSTTALVLPGLLLLYGNAPTATPLAEILIPSELEQFAWVIFTVCFSTDVYAPGMRTPLIDACG